MRKLPALTRKSKGEAITLESEKSFRRLTLVLFAVLAGINYFPVFFGKIPFPSDMLLQFPAWARSPHPEILRSYADIGDIVTYFYPARAIAAEAARHGTLPLWNPYFISGGAFVGSAQSALFYPPNFLYYVLPVSIAWTICILLKMVLCGFFMTLFARSIGISKFGAIFSGMVFAYCGFMTAFQGQPITDAALWLPFIAYAVHRLYHDRSRRSIALTGIGFAMPVLAGHPETAAHMTLAGGVTFLLVWLSSIDMKLRRFNLPHVFWFGVAGLLAMGLASVQMLPTVEWLRQLVDPLGGAWPPLEKHQILGLISRDILRGPNSAGILVPQAAAYVGMITLLAAPLALLYRPRRYAIMLAGITVAAFGVAYGFQPFLWLAYHTPVLSGLKNDRMILIGGFGLAALSGFGISFLEELQFNHRHRRILATALLGLSTATGLLMFYVLVHSTQMRVEFMRRPSFSRAMLLLGLIPLVCRLYGLGRRAFAFAACAIVLFDLATFAYGYTGFAKTADVFPNSPLFDFLKKNAGPARFRIAEFSDSYPSNAPMMYGVSAADGYETRISLQQRIFSSDFSESRLDSVIFTAKGLLNYADRRLDMLNVKYLVFNAYDPEYKLFSGNSRFLEVYNDGYAAILENKRVLPRAFAVPASGIEMVPGVDERLGLLRNPAFNPEQTVLLSAPPPEIPVGVDPNVVHNEVNVRDSGFNHVSLQAQIAQAGILVLSQTYYPGWSAAVDGRPVSVVPVDIALTGIPLPAGTHEVEFTFRPLSIELGAALSVLSLAVTGGLLFKR